VIALVEGDGYLGSLQVLEGSGADRHDLSGCELLLPLGLIGVRPTKDVVDLLESLREITLWVFCLLLLLDLFGQFEDFIREALQPVTVPCLVLSLRVENVVSHQETLILTRPRLILGPILMQVLHVSDGSFVFPFLVIWL
jgi:hypothetical protein